MREFYRICEWVTKLVYINVLWILFSTAGLLVFGFMPASIAMFTVIRRWIHGNHETAVFTEFYNTFKKEFFKGNAFGLIILIVGLNVYLYVHFLPVIAAPLNSLLLIFIFLLGLIYLMFVIYIVPVYVHYDLPFVQYFKYTIYVGMTNVNITFLLAAGVGLLCYFFIRVPGFIPFFSMSAIGFYIMWLADKGFENVLLKYEKYSEESLS